MKKIWLLILLGSIILTKVYSQTEYKHFWGGSINTSASIANLNSDNLQDVSNIKSGTSVYYGFLIKQISLGFGADVLIRRQSYNDLQISEIEHRSMMIYPFIRYNFKKGLFIHTQLNFGSSFITKSYDPQANVRDADKEQQNYLLIGTSIGLGYSIKVGERFFIEPMYKVVYSSNKSLENEYDSFTSSDVMIDLGVAYKF